ncbi:8-oxo-dGTP diphosphatase [Pseudalkalibacillus caeni]|uniref:8-oxo-dGTP diphosphatase n=1 Tax=Exobacillus caeni TaxID=2574798 RepID=A0A5R9F0X9_9BACL|nr:8-oxo-dGTP diphosphatase [Pseudalkalibacillus caeni]TLS37292.1 8-oxo-dGTP diphosphatase [Pseudalkalibacillus caeni]
MAVDFKDIEHQMYTMVMISDNERVLLINRPDKKGFPGYLAPGGKIDFPESLVEGAIREVKEETGLTVKNLQYKGLDEYVNPIARVRYMVFNYLATEFEGDLLENPPEGELEWVPIDSVENLPMQDWFRKRFPLFFEEGTFEIQVVWDQEKQVSVESKLVKT